jgi:hypothetical protein
MVNLYLLCQDLLEELNKFSEYFRMLPDTFNCILPEFQTGLFSTASLEKAQNQWIN